MNNHNLGMLLHLHQPILHNKGMFSRLLANYRIYIFSALHLSDVHIWDIF